MKTTTTVNDKAARHRWKPLAGILIAASLVGITGCSTTRQVGKVHPSGFLPENVYGEMKEGLADRAVMYYQKGGVDWKKYTKLWIQPIQLWEADDPSSNLGQMPKDQQQYLVDMAYTCLKADLGTEFQLVTSAGPDTLILKSAITDNKKCRPVINLVSSLYPAALAISYGKQMITGTGTGVGSVQCEAEIVDSQTGEVLAAGVDRRAGTKALRSKFSGTWGDAKLAFHWWSQHIATRFAELREGIGTEGT